MDIEKITYNLKNYLEKNDPLGIVEVVIELTPTLINLDFLDLPRNEMIALRKQNFMKELAPIAKVISNQGGNILDSVWLNQTIKAKVPIKSIEELAQLQGVITIDLPNRLTLD